ncbi:MAG: tetratricopeptide repeat protein [Acidobacteria bacterium]|nr:tetratricopeptide repeat protein [Acidobacteriota bacterium]
MKSRQVPTATGCALLLAGALGAGFVSSAQHEDAAAKTAGRIVVDYPAQDSVFPPEFPPPQFEWRDGSAATRWRVEVEFADGAKPLVFQARGERMEIGEIDPAVVSGTNAPPKLTPEQAVGHTWRPDAVAWQAIKSHSVARAVRVQFQGFVGNGGQPVSKGSVEIHTSADAVGAPVFYRDVPLMPTETEQGVIKPLAASAIPRIAWRVRDLSSTRSRVVLTGMPTCANCHSFTSDGKTLGMDLDGPQNDKGLYTLAAVRPRMEIRNQDMIEWRSVRGKLASPIRVGFMSQVSPDGRYVVTTINPVEAGVAPYAGMHNSSGYYTANFADYRFLQVFYLTRGVLAWYNRDSGRLEPLPGASDPRYVQVSAFWTPDGKSLIFERAAERDPYPEGAPVAKFAGSPDETRIQYDLYRIPFNEGRGGTAEPIAGASQNGMSNSFPKVSPDGKWIVFVKARNGQLMRPDGELWIIPAEGGVARRLRSNAPPMNSWHSWSPNSRWLVFSSKRRSPYTQMFLTHIDAEGNDSPAILVENSTAANRAVNLPEFVNMPAEGLQQIDVPAVEFYRVVDAASELAKKGKTAEAVAAFERALRMDPDDARTRVQLGVELVRLGRNDEARAEFERGRTLDPRNADAYANLGSLAAGAGQMPEAIAEFERALKLAPGLTLAQSGMCGALALAGGRAREALPYCEAALEKGPQDAETHSNMAIGLSEMGRLDEAIAHFETAARLLATNAAIQTNLAAALAQSGRLDEAAAHFRKALELEPSDPSPRYSLGQIALMQGRPAEALAEWRRLLQAQPGHLPALVQSALLMAVGPDASLRDGVMALEFSQRAVKVSGGEDARAFYALAASYGANGRARDGLQAARDGLAVAVRRGDSGAAEALRRLIAQFEAGQQRR